LIGVVFLLTVRLMSPSRSARRTTATQIRDRRPQVAEEEIAV
jgi:hypothetical protein